MLHIWKQWYVCLQVWALHITPTFEFYLSVPPKITPFSFARDLNVGDRTSIQCVVVTGDLPLSFVWLKDQHSSLTDISTRQYDDFTSTLSIGSITRAHSGNYTCRVSNAASTVTHTAQLRVNGNTMASTQSFYLPACLSALPYRCMNDEQLNELLSEWDERIFPALYSFPLWVRLHNTRQLQAANYIRYNVSFSWHIIHLQILTTGSHNIA